MRCQGETPIQFTVGIAKPTMKAFVSAKREWCSMKADTTSEDHIGGSEGAGGG